MLTYWNPISLRCCPMSRMMSASIPVSFLCFLFLTASAEETLPLSSSSHPLLSKRSPLATGLLPFSKITPFDCITSFELEEIEFPLVHVVLKEGSPISVSRESRALFTGGGVNPPSPSLSDEARAYTFTRQSQATRNSTHFWTLSQLRGTELQYLEPLSDRITTL